MSTRTLALLSLVTSAGLFACKPAAQPAPQPPPAPLTDHAHAEEEHGAEVELGAQKAGEFELKAVVGAGLAAAGEAHVEVKVVGATKPTALRAWIGGEDSAKSVVAKLEDEGDHYHGHVEVPAKLDPAAKLFVEAESAAGKAVASFDLTKAR